MVEVWLGTATKTTWLGLGRDHGLGLDDVLCHSANTYFEMGWGA